MTTAGPGSSDGHGVGSGVAVLGHRAGGSGWVVAVVNILHPVKHAGMLRRPHLKCVGLIISLPWIQIQMLKIHANHMVMDGR